MKCPKCHHENPPEARFCMMCTHRLISLSQQDPLSLSFDEKIDKIQRYLPRGLTKKILSQKDKIEGERKQVTVMFCDMVGFTPFVDKLGSVSTKSMTLRVRLMKCLETASWHFLGHLLLWRMRLSGRYGQPSPSTMRLHSSMGKEKGYSLFVTNQEAFQLIFRKHFNKFLININLKRRH